MLLFAARRRAHTDRGGAASACARGCHVLVTVSQGARLRRCTPARAASQRRHALAPEVMQSRAALRTKFHATIVGRLSEHGALH
jgi:hypothetical protein